MPMTTKPVQFTFAPLLKQQSSDIVRKKGSAIKYRDNPRDLRSEDFWLPIKAEMDEANNIPVLDLRLLTKSNGLENLS